MKPSPCPKTGLRERRLSQSLSTRSFRNSAEVYWLPRSELKGFLVNSYSDAGGRLHLRARRSGWSTKPSATVDDPAPTAGDTFGRAVAVSTTIAVVSASETGAASWRCTRRAHGAPVIFRQRARHRPGGAHRGGVRPLVIVIGLSMGSLINQEMPLSFPELVRCAIAMGQAAWGAPVTAASGWRRKWRG
jgi:hypothetical protein